MKIKKFVPALLKLSLFLIVPILFLHFGCSATSSDDLGSITVTLTPNPCHGNLGAREKLWKITINVSNGYEDSLIVTSISYSMNTLIGTFSDSWTLDAPWNIPGGTNRSMDPLTLTSGQTPEGNPKFTRGSLVMTIHGSLSDGTTISEVSDICILD